MVAGVLMKTSRDHEEHTEGGYPAKVQIPRRAHQGLCPDPARRIGIPTIGPLSFQQVADGGQSERRVDAPIYG